MRMSFGFSHSAPKGSSVRSVFEDRSDRASQTLVSAIFWMQSGLHGIRVKCDHTGLLSDKEVENMVGWERV